jgi:hypothetical protein
VEEGCAEEARRLEKERAETGLADERDSRPQTGTEHGKWVTNQNVREH